MPRPSLPPSVPVGVSTGEDQPSSDSDRGLWVIEDSRDSSTGHSSEELPPTEATGENNSVCRRRALKTVGGMSGFKVCPLSYCRLLSLEPVGSCRFFLCYFFSMYLIITKNDCRSLTFALTTGTGVDVEFAVCWRKMKGFHAAVSELSPRGCVGMAGLTCMLQLLKATQASSLTHSGSGSTLGQDKTA